MDVELFGSLESTLREIAVCGSLAAFEAARVAPPPARPGDTRPLACPAGAPSLAEVYAWIDGVSGPLARRLASNGAPLTAAP